MSHRQRAIHYVSNLVSVTAQLTITPLLAFTKLEAYETLLFAVLNDDTVNTVDVLIETSEDGVAVDAEQTYTLTVPVKVSATPGQRSLIVLDNVRGWYRVSATATGAPVAVRWTLKGSPRRL